MTSSNDLKKLSVIYDIRLDDVLYLKDYLNNPKNGCFILNLDFSNGGGTHFVGLISNKNLFYYDSFGSIDSKIKEELEKKTKKKLFYNNVKTQHLDEKICGPISLAWLKEAENVKNENDFNKSIIEVNKYTIVMPKKLL